VIDRGADGEAAVAFSSNDATKLEDERDNEELRRLLYVGVTRARDRLYLASQIDGRQQLRCPGRSLANLLPASLAALFADAAMNPDRRDVTWMGTAAGFTFSVCRPGTGSETRGSDTVADAAPLDVAPLSVRKTTSGVVSPKSRETTPEVVFGRQRLLGTVVHRLIQMRFDPATPLSGLSQRLAAFVPAEDRLDVENWDELVNEGLARYAAMYASPQYRELVESGECLFEVPFSHAAVDAESGADTVVRGVIDCLVVPTTGPATVLEFKTGVPRGGHDEQARRYQAAIRAILGKNDVEVKILYV